MRVVNNHEYKVCILSNDVPGSFHEGFVDKPFFTHYDQQGHNTRKTADDEEVLQFAMHAFQTYKERLGKLKS